MDGAAAQKTTISPVAQGAPSQGETIVAIATAIAPQQGSVGIVRLSGAEAVAIARTLFYVPGQQPWESHRILRPGARPPHPAAGG